MVKLKFKKLHPDAILPHRGTEGSVGWDVHAYIISETGRPEKKLIGPGRTMNISTGLLIEPPEGYFVMVCSRSGLAKNSVFVGNAPGIIDPDYRGEVRVLVHNSGYEYCTIHHEDRIGQLVVVPVIPISVVETDVLSETGRGEAGFGSTGR